MGGRRSRWHSGRHFGRGLLIAGCVAAGVALSGPPLAHAEVSHDVADIRGLHLQAPGPPQPGVRDTLLAQAARDAVAEAWRRRYPGLRPPALSERLVAEAVRHIDLQDETIAADRYAVTLDVAVAMDVLRSAAGLPAEPPPIVADDTLPAGLPTVRPARMPAPAPLAPPAVPGPRWLHVGPSGSEGIGPSAVIAPLPIGRFVGTGRRHPGLHCLSSFPCVPE